MFVVLFWDLCTEAVQKTAWRHFILVLDIYFLMYKKHSLSIFKNCNWNISTL